MTDNQIDDLIQDFDVACRDRERYQIAEPSNSARNAATKADWMRSLAALREALRAARKDSEDAARWRYIRPMLVVETWSLTKHASLTSRLFRVPSFPSAEATVEEIVDAARSSSLSSEPRNG